jgi:eukaryotic-like serine/threonine-protein kinase
MRHEGDSGPLSDGHCPDAGLLVEHARGTLASPERERIAEHVAICETCRDVLALWTRAPASSTKDAPEGAPPFRPRPGDVLAGKYEVLRVLGVGGMGVVLAARHMHMERTVALKLMLPHALSTESTERFLREARAAAQVQGEHVARVLDVGTLEDKTPFLVMEYLEGTDLARLLRSRGPLPVEEAVGFVLQACEALAEAHAAGIVHRDLKPANLFVTARPDGSALLKVLDFGISKLTHAGKRLEASLTKSQTVMGTPLYMSPEQLRSTRDAGPETDVWSLGCVLYELCAARPAFWAESPEALGALIATGPAPLLREVRGDAPEEVEAVILACLEKDPARRIGSAAELARRLSPFASADTAISAERAARISRGAPSLPFADTVVSDRPPPPGDGGHPQAPGQATAGSFVRSEAQPAGRPRRQLVGYALVAMGAAGIALAGYSFSSRWGASSSKSPATAISPVVEQAAPVSAGEPTPPITVAAPVAASSSASTPGKAEDTPLRVGSPTPLRPRAPASAQSSPAPAAVPGVEAVTTPASSSAVDPLHDRK